MDLGAATHPGYVRSDNEDGFYASGEHAVFAVADGMGGHDYGEVASHLALEAIIQHAESIAQAEATALPAQLHQAIQDANAAILSQTVDQEARNRMGTTIVVAAIHGDRLYFAHIGDSRLYLLRGELFTQLTRDHSLVQTMVDRGEITPEEAAIHPLRHQITRVVGGDDYISPEIASQALEPGDLVLLCTDGLSGVVSPEELHGMLAGKGTCQEKADALIQAALQAGGPDNITAVLLAYQKPHPKPEPPAHPFPHLSFRYTVLIILLFMILSTLGFAQWSYTHPTFHVRANEQGNVELYQRWTGLPMLGTRQLPNVRQIAIPLNEVREYATEYGDLDEGIPVKDRDTGEQLVNTLVENATSALLDQAKQAVEDGTLTDARALLSRAEALGADPNLVLQIEKMMTKAESTPSLPRRTTAPR
ncbi:MAG: Stp1/IreP family PP2C-type Ser/Thr phosphatase [Armatimonadota bacterium]